MVANPIRYQGTPGVIKFDTLASGCLPACLSHGAFSEKSFTGDSSRYVAVKCKEFDVNRGGIVRRLRLLWFYSRVFLFGSGASLQD